MHKGADMESTVRWSLKVSRETDEALRAYLGQCGGRKGDLSRFIEEAVRARLTQQIRSAKPARPAAPTSRDDDFARTVEAIRARTRALTTRQAQRLAADAVAFARKSRTR